MLKTVKFIRIYILRKRHTLSFSLSLSHGQRGWYFVRGGEGDFYIQGFFLSLKKVNLYNFLLASLATSSKFAVNLSYILVHVYLTH